MKKFVLLPILFICFLFCFNIHPAICFEKLMMGKNWDGSMMLNPEWRRVNNIGKNECFITLEVVRYINPSYKNTGGAYVTIIMRRFRIAGYFDVDYTKGTFNGKYYKCIDNGDREDLIKSKCKIKKYGYRRIVYDVKKGKRVVYKER